MAKGYDMMAEQAAPQFEEKQFFEYHLYTLQRKTTIKDNQTKQVTLLDAGNAGVKKVYIVQPGGSYWFVTAATRARFVLPALVVRTIQFIMASTIGITKAMEAKISKERVSKRVTPSLQFTLGGYSGHSALIMYYADRFVYFGTIQHSWVSRGRPHERLMLATRSRQPSGPKFPK